jgi:cell division protein FtsW (lipid II flippase)
MIVAFVCVLIMLENHFSGTLITFMIGATVVFCGGAMIRWFALAGGVMFTAVFAVLFGTDYASERIDIWLHPENFSVRDETWQTTQGLIAIGSGGVFGKGFLEGTQVKYNFVPENHTDFIFCTVGEEWGFVGCMVVLAMYCTLILRLMRIGERQEEPFGRIYCYCVASILLFHLMVNVGMTIGLMPVMGIPLPFMSYGGSSLLAFTLLLFIAIRFDASRRRFGVE